MKITKVETITSKEFNQVCWVRIYTDNGKIGLGETWYLPQSVAMVIHELFAQLLQHGFPIRHMGRHIW